MQLKVLVFCCVLHGVAHSKEKRILVPLFLPRAMQRQKAVLLLRIDLDYSTSECKVWSKIVGYDGDMKAHGMLMRDAAWLSHY